MAAALAATGEGGSRLETKLVVLSVASRAITIAAGLMFGLLKPPPNGHFAIAAAVIITFATIESLHQLRAASLRGARVLTLVELCVSVGAIMSTGAFKSPFVLTPITGLEQ